MDLRSTAELKAEGPAPLQATGSVRHVHLPILPEEGAATDVAADVLLTRVDADRSRYPADPVTGHYLGYLEDRPDQVVAALRTIAMPRRVRVSPAMLEAYDLAVYNLGEENDGPLAEAAWGAPGRSAMSRARRLEALAP